MSLPGVSIVPAHATPVNALARSLVTVVCAASAGVHLALVPAHLEEGGPALGGAFAVATVALGVGALAARRPRRSGWPLAAVAAALLGVAGAYLLSRTSGIAPLHQEAEAFDPLGVLTTIAELVAAVAAGRLLLTRKDQQ